MPTNNELANPSSRTFAKTTRGIATLASAMKKTTSDFKEHAQPKARKTWQGVDVSSKPDMAMHELLYYTLVADLNKEEDLEVYRSTIRPNVPWADDHFAERVSGNPLNPGEQWRHWPWGHSADRFRLDPRTVGDAGPDRVFDHTYMQRYWPKYAGYFPGGMVPTHSVYSIGPHKGIYFPYGDLMDVVDELFEDQQTRQAILPVFFPEDTGLRPGRRKPCSLSYQFQMSEGCLDIVYVIRSCDIVRHFRDDIYLTVRLLLWVLDRLRERSRQWYSVKPGLFVMHIANLHCFANDWVNKETSIG